MATKRRIKIFRLDPNNPEHKDALRELVKRNLLEHGAEDWAADGDGSIESVARKIVWRKVNSQVKGKMITYLQKFGDDYSGFITVEPRNEEKNKIQKLEVPKDTKGKIRPPRKELFIHDIFVKPEYRETQVFVDPKTEEVLFKEKRKEYLGLAAKLIRYAAKTHGLPVNGVWIPPQGVKFHNKYASVYDEAYFKFRGMKLPNKLKKRKKKLL